MYEEWRMARLRLSHHAPGVRRQARARGLTQDGTIGRNLLGFRGESRPEGTFARLAARRGSPARPLSHVNHGRGRPRRIGLIEEMNDEA
jgi:hypothetical protein